MLGGTIVTLNNNPSQYLQYSTRSHAQVQINTTNPSQPVYAVSPQITNIYDYELGATSTRQVTQTTTNSSYDNYGNVLTSSTTVTDTDSGNGNPYNGDAWTTTTTNSPVVDTTPPSGTNWCLNLMTQVVVTYKSTDTGANNTGSGVVTRTKGFTPDPGGHCWYSQIVTEPQGTPLSSLYMVQENLGHDGFGNISSDTVVGTNMGNNPATRTTTTNWGATGQLPNWVQDPMYGTTGAKTQFSYDPRFGVLASAIDQNGAKTQWPTLDGFGRPLKRSNADGTTTTWSYQSCALVSFCPASAQVLIIVTTYDSGGNYIRDVQSYSDGADRIFQSYSRNQNQGTGGHTYTYSGWQYDALGRLTARTIPILAVPGTAVPQATYSYDALNRVLSEVDPVNGSTATKHYGYSGRTTTIQDGNSHTRTLISDVNGWLRQTKDAMGTYAIILGYDAAGSRNSVTDNQGNTLSTATYQYGTAPFMVSSTDTDLGSWSYSYDALGELVSWSDPAHGQAFSMTYDALSRPKTRSEPDLFTQWNWGSSAAAYEIGKLHSVCTGTTTANPTTCDGSSYAENETYDSAERPLTRQIQIPGEGTYTYSWAYNSMGLTDTLTYPATPQGFQLQLKYGYTNGLPTSITDIPDNIPLWSTNSTSSVDGFGHYLQETLGNGVQVTHQFKADTGLINSITAVKGSTSLQNNSYLFDNVGNLGWRGDGITGTSESVYYDADDRLSYTVGDTAPGLTYDSAGRIATWSAYGGTTNVIDYTTPQSQCTYYTNSQMHAQRQKTQGTGVASYCYDANGNETENTWRGAVTGTFTWTSFNQPNLMTTGWPTITTGTGTSQFYYDHNHQRWKQAANYSGSTETTEYIGDSLEEVVTSSGTTYRYYVPAGNNFVVYSRSGTTSSIYYATRDQIGSTAAVFDSSGNLFGHENFAAMGWGEGISSEGASVSRREFTGHEGLDNLTCEVNMLGRVFDCGGGLFMLSPDPFIPHPDDTRSYNRYAYARYNPMTYTDPSGFGDCSDDTDCFTITVYSDGGGGGGGGGNGGGITISTCHWGSISIGGLCVDNCGYSLLTCASWLFPPTLFAGTRFPVPILSTLDFKLPPLLTWKQIKGWLCKNVVGVGVSFDEIDGPNGPNNDGTFNYMTSSITVNLSTLQLVVSSGFSDNMQGAGGGVLASFGVQGSYGSSPAPSWVTTGKLITTSSTPTSVFGAALGPGAMGTYSRGDDSRSIPLPEVKEIGGTLGYGITGAAGNVPTRTFATPPFLGLSGC
jgi:RHS repeat-associated protein